MSCLPLTTCLMLAASLFTAAPAWAARSTPSLELMTLAAPFQVAQCLESGIKGWKIPLNYIDSTQESRERYSLRLTNPVTGRSGFEVVMEPGLVRLFERGPKLSKQWLRLIRRCAGS
ncbi:hypothetical protein [Craterilacuibacter sp.]|uniref:hypothetical protein n=1 Tax=Craterilacuibacter sp. TaxID=2870909 RepID=UPI003F382AC2